MFGWPRYPGAVYYQFYLQQGARTIYQARTVRPTAALPARLKVVPGTYRVLVRPAIPSDAGIILGAAIVDEEREALGQRRASASWRSGITVTGRAR